MGPFVFPMDLFHWYIFPWIGRSIHENRIQRIEKKSIKKKLHIFSMDFRMGKRSAGLFSWIFLSCRTAPWILIQWIAQSRQSMKKGRALYYIHIHTYLRRDVVRRAHLDSHRSALVLSPIYSCRAAGTYSLLGFEVSEVDRH